MLPKNKNDKLKRAVIKEELVALVQDVTTAIILNQFIYWQERTKDFDKFIVEENERLRMSNGKNKINLTSGWIYKKAEDLSEETLLGLSVSNMRRHINKLVDAGFIQQRKNPLHRWDRTIQYRVDMIKIRTNLKKLGYVLEGYAQIEVPISKIEIARKHSISKMKIRSFEIEIRKSKTETRMSKMKIRTAQNRTAIPKTTTEITTEITTETTSENTFKEKAPAVPKSVDNFVRKKHRQDDELSDTPIEPSIQTKTFLGIFQIKYKLQLGIQHPVIADKKVIAQINAIFSTETYYSKSKQTVLHVPGFLMSDMVRKYLGTRYQADCDYSIWHFLSDGIFSNLVLNCLDDLDKEKMVMA